jgi:hypothetical protein
MGSSFGTPSTNTPYLDVASNSDLTVTKVDSHLTSDSSFTTKAGRHGFRQKGLHKIALAEFLYRAQELAGEFGDERCVLRILGNQHRARREIEIGVLEAGRDVAPHECVARRVFDM